jgi:hypothetical protein
MGARAIESRVIERRRVHERVEEIRDANDRAKDARGRVRALTPSSSVAR